MLLPKPYNEGRRMTKKLLVILLFNLLFAAAPPARAESPCAKDTSETERLRQQLAQITYAHQVDRARREWEANRVDWAAHYLEKCPAELRGWEWRYVYRLCHAELRTCEVGRPVLSVA